MTNLKLLEQFRSFYARNFPDDMEIQIEYFSIFGGLGLDIDTQKPIKELLHELVFNNFEEISKNIRELTLDNQENKRLLRALAIGDRRIFSAFKRAGLNNGNGGGALNYLQERGLIQIEYSREEHPRDLNPNEKLKREVARHRISHKVLFTHPFIRFWFYFIAPHYKELEAKEYDSFFENLED